MSREESRLALKLARDWVLTPVARDILESATLPWGVHAPERTTLACWRWDPTEQLPRRKPRTLTFGPAGLPTASALP